jgi:predicted dehydrogenase
MEIQKGLRMTKAKVAIVGLGKMGLLHASILSTFDNVELVALCEKSALIRRFAGKVTKNIRVVASVEDLGGMELDAIYVTTPVSSHAPVIKTVYTQRIAKNVFVEKPLASNSGEAEELCNLAEKLGSINMVGYNRRFSVTFRKARQILDERILGDPTFFVGYAYSSDFAGAKWGSKSGRGGVLSDLGSHLLDLALWLFGELEVKGARLESLVSADAEDAAYVSVKTPSSLNGEFRISWCKENFRLPDIGLQLEGPNGTMMVNEDKVELKLNSGSSSLWHKHDLGDNVPFFIGGAEYQREDEFFVSSALHNTHAEPSFQTASRVEKLIDQVKAINQLN